MTKNITAVDSACLELFTDIIKARAERGDADSFAYSSVRYMLEYVLLGSYDCLSQFWQDSVARDNQPSINSTALHRKVWGFSFALQRRVAASLSAGYQIKRSTHVYNRALQSGNPGEAATLCCFEAASPRRFEAASPRHFDAAQPLRFQIRTPAKRPKMLKFCIFSNLNFCITRARGNAYFCTNNSRPTDAAILQRCAASFPQRLDASCHRIRACAGGPRGRKVVQICNL